MGWLASTVALCFVATPAALADDYWGHDFDDMIAHRGVKVIFSQINNEGSREIRLPSGVSFVQMLQNGKLSVVIGNDNSGHLAVMCGITMLMTLRHALSTCAANQNANMIPEIDAKLDRIVDFIVANTVPPQPQVSKAALRAQIEQEKEKVAVEVAGAPREIISAYCAKGDGASMIKHLGEEGGVSKMWLAIDDSLSVPRPPVLNPCF
jgi:hypothetical protein